VSKAEVSARLDGKPLTAGLAWLGGFGDLTVTNPRPIETVNVVYSEGGKLNALPYKKLTTRQSGARPVVGRKRLDRYRGPLFRGGLFARLQRPSGKLETRYWKVWHPVQIDGKNEAEPVPQIATATNSPTDLRIYVGPKDYDVLKRCHRRCIRL